MAPPSSRISGANPVFDEAELVFGLVAPVGTNFSLIQHRLKRCLEQYGYCLNVVRLSGLTENFEVERDSAITGSKEFVRIHHAMDAGNYLRSSSLRGEFLALAAAKTIFEKRADPPKDPVLRSTAHLLRSLKHPDEVRALRRIYGAGFFLIGVVVDEEQRRTYLKDERGCDDAEIARLLERDEHEEDARYIAEDGENYGQRTRDTFQLADAFLRLEDEAELSRFVSLVFGCPFETPRKDEHAMFLAFASALRSGDLSRQVGAVVVAAGGDLVSTGANDVPRAGGGLYWPGEEDHRDHRHQGGKDSNERRRNEIVEDVLLRLKPKDEIQEAWLAEGKSKLVDSPLMDITEYGRAVHAEMEALLSCARSGCSPTEGELFSTTFPCHNCAKHIVAAGIKRVVYVEPYPKSQAMQLFPDSIRLQGRPDDAGLGPPGKVIFEPFTGVGPRRFFDLFSMGLSSGTKLRRKAGWKKAPWQPSSANVRVPLLPNSYLDREVLAANELLVLTKAKSDEEENHS